MDGPRMDEIKGDKSNKQLYQKLKKQEKEKLTANIEKKKWETHFKQRRTFDRGGGVGEQ